ncbi:MAG: flavin reductase family protein [Bacteroidales bacterium]|jgi:flavin reductase (DIM6/NTAB) family NADH-FMN oxidoreductase RutF
MLSYFPADISSQRMHQLLLGSIGPRPIAFASTVDAEGRPNLSPFSFFNVFGVNPTTLIFSPSRRGRDNTTKHTYENVKAVPEVVINVVTYEMVNQASLASTEFPGGVDEFEKAGFTKLDSEKVKPFRVKESPVQLECKVRDVIETGQGGGAANLVICEVLLMHISEDVLAEDGLIDQEQIRLVGRMGRDWYCKAFGEGIFRVEKPISSIGIGVDSLPEHVRMSRILTGNDLGRLGNLPSMPSRQEIEGAAKQSHLIALLEKSNDQHHALHSLAKELIDRGEVYEALKVLLI